MPTSGQLMSPRPLSVKEQALWMLQRLVPDSGVSNESLVFTVDGRLAVDVLAGQVRALVSRHPLLRTTFPEINGEPAALARQPGEVSPDVVVDDSPQSPVEQAVAGFASAPFDIVNDIPIRVGLWRYPDGDVCCIAMHHLAYDAWTAGIIYAELVAGYNAALTGTPGPATAVAVAVDPHVEPPLDPRSLAYWRAHVAGIDPAAQRLAIGGTDPDVPTFDGEMRVHILSPESRAAVSRMAEQQRVTENIIYLAAYYLLLARHGGGPDIVVGVPVDVRDNDGRTAVGYHVNTLPIRVAVDLSGSFPALVGRTSEAFLTGLRHRHVPYEAVLPDLQAAGQNWRSPLFRCMFNYRPVPVPTDSVIGGMAVRFLSARTRHSREDLEFVVETQPGESWVRAVYSTEIFTEADIEALQLRYEALLVALAESGTAAMTTANWWSVPDRRTVENANDTADETPVPLVGAAVMTQHSAGIAFVDGDRRTTYGQLLDHAEAVREELQSAGAGRGDVVAVYARRGAPLAAAVLGIWAAGAAYLPLHPDNPAGLLGLQLSDSRASVLLRDRPLPSGTPIPCPQLDLPAPGRATAPAPAYTPAPDDRAYVIYTSGSTGTPKGVQITHANLANLIAHFRHELDVTADDAMLWLTTFAFDISALELFLPLSTGGRVVVAPDEARAEGEIALRLIKDHDVRIVQATPTTWATLAPAAAGALAGRRVLCGGEPLPAALAADLLATGADVYNVYGPTETTIWSTVAQLAMTTTQPVPIGRPIRNTEVFVADSTGTALPPGIPGELCVRGGGVALGYLGHDDLTADRFRVSPVAGRHYRTGDRARWRYDGTLELLGRTDRQVKIRAHRLELGEVESVLVSHPGVAVAAVVLRDELPEHARLVAFVQPAADGSAELVDSVWQHCRDRLPGHALPARVVTGPVPLTVNGKIDYRALAIVSLPGNTSTADPPQQLDATVQRLVSLWRDLLDDPDIGPADNFFLSGGHSLVAVRMLSRIRDLSGVTVPLTTLLAAPTPVLLAGRLASVTW